MLIKSCHQKCVPRMKFDLIKKKMENVTYMQAVGSLLFAPQITCPDINYAVNLLSRFTTNHWKSHWDQGETPMRYLKGTTDKGITYQCSQDGMDGNVPLHSHQREKQVIFKHD